MTVTHPPAGLPAACRAAARPWTATVRAAAAAALVALLVLAGTTAARADTTPSPTPTDLSGEATLTLAPVGEGVVAPGSPLSAWLTLDNGTDSSMSERTATVSLGDDALVDRTELSAWLSGDAPPDDLDEVAAVTIPPVASGASIPVSVRVEPDAAALQNRKPGVYPLLATTPGTDGSITSRSVMIVPGTATPAPVGVIVPIAAGPLSEGLLTSDQLAELTAADGLLTAAVDAVSGTAAILAIDPAIPAAIRVLGSSAPETATDWLDRLLRLPNERFALQFGDADVAAQVRSTAAAPLQPTSLQSYMDAADFAGGETGAAASPTPSPSPSSTEAPSGPALPDLATLLDIGATRSDVYWPLTGTASADVVSVLGTSATGADTPLTLVGSATIDAGDRVAAAPGRAGDSALLVYDSDASAALRDTAVEADNLARGAPLTAAAGYLSFTAGSIEPSLVVVDRANDYSRAGLRAAISAVTEAPGATPLSLTQLAGAEPGTVAFGNVKADDDRSAAASQLSADEAALGSFSSILDDPTVLTGPERATMLQLLGAGWAPESDSWSEAITAHRTATASTLDAVGILPPTTTNLIASGADLRFWVRNDLRWPVNVILNATSDNVRLEVKPSTQVRANAASNTRPEIPVQARRGNGEAAVSLQLTSPSGVPIGAGQQVDVNVRADWEGVGIVILFVLVAGLLGLGLVRTVLHRRWLRRQADAAAAVPASTAPGAAG